MSFNADFIQIDKTTLTVPNDMKSPHLLQKIENIVNILVFQDCFSLIISKLLTVGPPCNSVSSQMIQKQWWHQKVFEGWYQWSNMHF